MERSLIETELKIPVSELDSVREALGRAGGELVHPMAREENILLDSAEGHLKASGRTLRLRRYGDHHVLTLKGPVSYEGGIKVRREDETHVADVGRLRVIFENLGFRAVARYEKDRESWRVGGVAVVLDRTPMGDFVEVEGSPQEIVLAALSLGLDPEQAVRGSYPSLWEDYRLRHPELDLLPDMVFPE